MTCKYCKLLHEDTDSVNTDEFNSLWETFRGNAKPVLNAKNAVSSISLLKVNGFNSEAFIDVYTEEDVENNTNPSFSIPIRFCPYCGDALSPGDA